MSSRILIKAALAVVVGGATGWYVGNKLACMGGQCPLTCNPWGGALTGIAIALCWALC